MLQMANMIADGWEIENESAAKKSPTTSFHVPPQLSPRRTTSPSSASDASDKLISKSVIDVNSKVAELFSNNQNQNQNQNAPSRPASTTLPEKISSSSSASSASSSSSSASESQSKQQQRESLENSQPGALIRQAPKSIPALNTRSVSPAPSASDAKSDSSSLPESTPPSPGVKVRTGTVAVPRQNRTGSKPVSVSPQRTSIGSDTSSSTPPNSFIPKVSLDDQKQQRKWAKRAISRVTGDMTRAGETPLHRVFLGAKLREAGISLYIKDEASQPTGSLSHRLARALFLYSLVNGQLRSDTTVVDILRPTHLNIGIAAAFYAQQLGLNYIAIVRRGASSAKMQSISKYGGEGIVVENDAEAQMELMQLRGERHVHFLDYVSNAGKALDWRNHYTLPESIFKQMADEEYATPEWIVCPLGATGTTAACIGRFIRFTRSDTRLCLAEPENSIFFDFWKSGDRSVTLQKSSSLIEEVGAVRVENGMVSEVVDDVVRVSDSASLAAMRLLAAHVARRPGPAAGTVFWAALQQVRKMLEEGTRGSVVLILPDAAEHYFATAYSDSWLRANRIELDSHQRQLQEFLSTLQWPAQLSTSSPAPTPKVATPPPSRPSSTTTSSALPQQQAEQYTL